MRSLVSVFGLFAAAMVTASPQPERDAIHAAGELLGVRRIRTLQFSGSGATFTVGQNFTPDEPWPRVTLARYTALINYETASMRQDLVREMGTAMPRGGGVPFIGERRQIQTVSGAFAWNEPIPPAPQVGSLPAACCTPPEVGGTPPIAAPAPESQTDCMLMLWSTPHGFIKAAMANGAKQTNVVGGTEVSFVVGGKYRMVGLINARGEFERVRTWLEQSIVGEMLVETEYRDYRDFGGMQFPSHIVRKEDGFPSLDLTVRSVVASPPAEITVPDDVRNATPPPVTVKSQTLAAGVLWLTGGTHHSLAVEMRDHIVLVDTPNGQARASAVLAKAKQLIPGKPVRYVVAMHHHWDHLGGIRTAIGEGATIVTHRSNAALLERAAKASGKPLKLQAIGDEGTLTDGTRTIKLYRMTDFDHTDDMLMVYLPKEKILAEADAYTPMADPAAPLIAPRIPYAKALLANIRRHGLDVQTIAPFHGMRTVTMAEVERLASP